MIISILNNHLILIMDNLLKIHLMLIFLIINVILLKINFLIIMDSFQNKIKRYQNLMIN